MCGKLYSAVKDNKERIFFFSLYLFDKDLYDSFNFQRVE